MKRIVRKFSTIVLVFTLVLSSFNVYAQDQFSRVIAEKSLVNIIDSNTTAEIYGRGNPDRQPYYGVDGIKNNVYFYAEVGMDVDQDKDNPYYFQVDLGSVKAIDGIGMWRYWADGRTYHDTLIFVSEDEEFTQEDIVYNSDKDNYFGYGNGENDEYAETENGKTILFDDTKQGRYIRFLNNGHDRGKGGHYVEVEVLQYGEKVVEEKAFENASTYLNIPTFEAVGKRENQVTHPDIVEFETEWNGYKYWMAVTPNQTGNSQFENPCIVASNDGITWVVPQEIDNPITGIKEEPRPYHNCDTDMVYNPSDDSLYVYYEWSKDSPAYGQNGFKPGEVRLIIVKKDELGNITCSKYRTVVTSTYRYDVLSPSIVRTPDGKWKMWAVNTGENGYCNQTNKVDYRESNDGINWSEPKSLENTFMQEGYLPWHIDVEYIPSKKEYWAIFPAYPLGGDSTNTKLFFAKSKDGKLWTTYNKPIIKTVDGSWDDEFIYRSTFIYESDTDKMRIWYSAGQSQGWHIAYTENTSNNMFEILGKGITPDINNNQEWHDASFDDIDFGDGWGYIQNEDLYLASQKGSTAALTFFGSGVKWIGQKDINFGIADVYIDDIKVETIDTYGSGSDVKKGLTLYETDNLVEGVHTIKIVATGTKNSSSYESNIDIESMEVLYDDSKTIDITGINLKADQTTIFEGATTTLSTQILPYNATDKNNIYFTSSDETIATVSDSGVVTAKDKGGIVTITAISNIDETIQSSVDIEVKIYQEPAELRMIVDQNNSLFLHHLYRLMNTGVPGPLQGGNSIQGTWDALMNGDKNGNELREDLKDNQSIIIHASGSVKGNDSTLQWYENMFEETKMDTPNDLTDDAKFFIMVSNSGTSSGGKYEPIPVEWTEKMYNQYPNMRGVLFSENHNAHSQWEITARSEYMAEQVALAAKYGGYVVYSDMNDNGDYVEKILSNKTLYNTLQRYSDNFILLAKTTSAWSNVSYNSHESVVQGAWLSEIAGNYGSLIDSWMWFIEGFGPLWGDETFDTFGGPEECRGPSTFPELLYAMRMIQQSRVGATVFTFEHPFYSTAVDNQFTPVFTDSIAKAMEYMEDNPSPTRREVIQKTKFAYSAENGTLNDLAGNGINLLNPLYGDSNYNGKNNTSMMVYSTGRYGTIPSLPQLVEQNIKDKFEYVYTKDDVLNNLRNEQGVKEFFDELYVESYTGNTYANKYGDTWFAYNQNWNIDSREDEELHSKEYVDLMIEDEISANIEMEPYTYVMVDTSNLSKINVKLNNFLVDKNPIWEGYDKNTTPHWDSDHTTHMYNYLINEYISDENRKDDIFRNTEITFKGFSQEPNIVVNDGMKNDDGSKQYEEPVGVWNSQKKEYVITISSNGWINFDVVENDEVIIQEEINLKDESESITTPSAINVDLN